MDIVARLRELDKKGYQPLTGAIGEEAAAEIERLRNARVWPIKGVRVDGDKVIVAVKGGNDAARWLCGEILSMLDAATAADPPQRETPNVRGHVK